MSSMIPSVFTNEQALLKSILSLHSPTGIELDPMYFKGNFYKEIAPPKYMFDINPQVDYCKVGDARNLPLQDCSINSMVLDPPFMFGIHGKAEIYYSSRTHGIFPAFSDLEDLYKGILNEAYRILVKNGILIFKCQDYTDSKTTLVHCFVWKWATDIGFYAKDLAILFLPKNKVWNSNLIQRHTRKVHSYFFVFEKMKKEKN